MGPLKHFEVEAYAGSAMSVDAALPYAIDPTPFLPTASTAAMSPRCPSCWRFGASLLAPLSLLREETGGQRKARKRARSLATARIGALHRHGCLRHDRVELSQRVHSPRLALEYCRPEMGAAPVSRNRGRRRGDGATTTQPMVSSRQGSSPALQLGNPVLLVSRRAFIPAALWVAVHLLVLPRIRNIVTGGDEELERQLRSTHALSSDQ